MHVNSQTNTFADITMTVIKFAAHLQQSKLSATYYVLSVKQQNVRIIKVLLNLQTAMYLKLCNELWTTENAQKLRDELKLNFSIRRV